MLSPPASNISQITPNNTRQIAIGNGGALTGVIYTVPAGRKFVGYIYGGTVVSTFMITPPGGTSSYQRTGSIQGTSFATPPIQIVLSAGTIVTGNGSELYLLGIESDL